MADKFMYIPNDDTHYYTLIKLHLVVEKFGHSSKFTKVHKVAKPTNKKTLLQTFGD